MAMAQHTVRRQTQTDAVFSSRLLTGQLCTAWLFTAGAASRRSLIQKLGRYPAGHKGHL